MEIKLIDLDRVGKAGIITTFGGIASTAIGNVMTTLPDMEDFIGSTVPETVATYGENMLLGGPITIFAGISFTALGFFTTARTRRRQYS